MHQTPKLTNYLCNSPNVGQIYATEFIIMQLKKTKKKSQYDSEDLKNRTTKVLRLQLKSEKNTQSTVAPPHQ